MTNPVLENIRRSLGRTAQTPLRTAYGLPSMGRVYPKRWILKSNAFLSEIKKLSGVGQTTFLRLKSPGALKKLVTEQNIQRATVWDTPGLNQLGIADSLQSPWRGTCFPECQ